MPWLLKMTLLAATVKAVVDLYLGWRLMRAVEYLGSFLSGNAGWAVVLFFLVFYIAPLTGLVQYLLGGNVDILTYPKTLLYLFWFGFAFSFQVLIWVVGMDLLKLLANAGGINAPQLDQLYGGLLLGIAVIMLGYTGYKMYSDTTSVVTEHISVIEQNLPEALQGFRIAHITDIQGDRYTGAEKIERYVQLVNQQNPDLVVVTGDLISYGTDYVEMAAQELSKIKAFHGTYFVIGDHDYWAGSEHIVQALVERNIKVLQGENAFLDVDGATIRLSGLTNVYSRKAPIEEIRAVTRDTTHKADLRVMLSHQVSEPIIDQSQAAVYEMLLAGHTHGGQIRVPLFFTKFSAPDFETQYVAGQYYKGDMLININNGLGFTLSPVRYNAPPNISVIELKSE